MPFRNLAKPANGGALRPTLRALLLLILAIGVFGGVLAYTVVRRGLSAHEEPSRVEEVLARTIRRLATPAAVREQRNPVQATDAVFDQALEHYADHCASCHANDGSGDTEIGRGLYPRVPDMRNSDTQSLSDGELFSIIEHGIRLSKSEVGFRHFEGRHYRALLRHLTLCCLTLTFVADHAGSFRFRCSVTCGPLHPFMIGKLYVGPNWTLLRGSALAVLAAVAGLWLVRP